MTSRYPISTTIENGKQVLQTIRKYTSNHAAKCAIYQLRSLGWNIHPIYPTKQHVIRATRPNTNELL